jgi:hypothetical protein
MPFEPVGRLSTERYRDGGRRVKDDSPDEFVSTSSFGDTSSYAATPA